MATVGPTIAGTGANDASFGTTAWTTPGNITTSDNTRTTAVLTGNSQYLKATNFGFSVPAGATIDGIEFRFERQSTSGTIIDVRVRAVKGGTIQSTDLSAGATWTAGTDTFNTFGGATSLWGTTWTATDINASDFGVVMACAGTPGTPAVDSVDCKIYYTVSGGVSVACQSGFFGL